MTEPTIDPSNGLIIDLEAEVKSIGNYLGCNEDELWSEISKLISDQVAKARIDELNRVPRTNYGDDFTVHINMYLDDRIKELNGVNNNE